MTRRRVFVSAVSIVVALAALAASRPPAARGDGGPAEPAPKWTPGVPPDPDYTAAVKAIKADQFPTAIRLLEGVVTRNDKSADAYNWLAYATRRNSNPAASIPIYEKALALDPKHRGAHEYIGEAYLALGNLPKAKEHLARLKSLCFFPCEEYSDLKKAVETYEKGRGAGKPSAGN